MSQRAKKGRPPQGKPISSYARRLNYLTQRGVISAISDKCLTGPQRRRLKHKGNHSLVVLRRRLEELKDLKTDLGDQVLVVADQEGLEAA